MTFLSEFHLEIDGDSTHLAEENTAKVTQTLC